MKPSPSLEVDPEPCTRIAVRASSIFVQAASALKSILCKMQECIRKPEVGARARLHAVQRAFFKQRGNGFGMPVVCKPLL